MTVEQATIIDAIGTDAATGCVHLTIADHLEWSDDHLAQLQEKLNSYLAFVESGEVHNAYPASVGRTFAIDLILKYRPNAEAEAFLAQVSTLLDSAGLAFSYGPADTYYGNNNG